MGILLGFLLRMVAVPLQRLEDGLRDRRRGGQVLALWLEPVLVRGVGQLDELSFGGVVLRGTAGVVAAHALLLLGDPVGGLELVVVAAVLLLQLVDKAPDLGMGVGGVGRTSLQDAGQREQDNGSDKLK